MPVFFVNAVKVTIFFFSKGDPLDPSKSTRELSTSLVNFVKFNILN